MRIFLQHRHLTTMRQVSRRLLLLLASSKGRSVSSFAAAAPTTRIPVWFDSTNRGHQDVMYHPEQPARITACVRALSEESCVQLLDMAAKPISLLPEDGNSDKNDEDDASSAVVALDPFSEDELEHAREMLLRTHDPELVTQLESRCRRAQQRLGTDDDDDAAWAPLERMDADTYGATETWDICVRAAAAWIRAVDRAFQDRCPTFALTRPPGHHATYGTANGFCWFNFAVAAALHAVKDGRRRVSILDWDVHYGQGITDIVAGHSHIRYASIHQAQAFPFMGQQRRVEHGNILTLPMAVDTTWTCGYQELWNEALDFVSNDDWQPDLVIVAAGFDALSADELAHCGLNAADFGRMTRQLRQHVPAGTAIMLGLEGGYQLKDVGPTGNLQQAVVETVRALAE